MYSIDDWHLQQRIDSRGQGQDRNIPSRTEREEPQEVLTSRHARGSHSAIDRFWELVIVVMVDKCQRQSHCPIAG